MKKMVLSWFGHVERMSDERWQKCLSSPTDSNGKSIWYADIIRSNYTLPNFMHDCVLIDAKVNFVLTSSLRVWVTVSSHIRFRRIDTISNNSMYICVYVRYYIIYLLSNSVQIQNHTIPTPHWYCFFLRRSGVLYIFYTLFILAWDKM